MQKSFYLLFFFLVCACSACKKDKGNYTYTDIDEIQVTDIATVYNFNYGDTFRVSPTVTGTISGNNADLSYEWHAILGATSGVVPDNSQPYRLISTSKNLEYPIKLNPATYPIFFKITNNKTGIEYNFNTSLVVGQPYGEGFLVLSSVADTSRLDYIRYNATNNTLAATPEYNLPMQLPAASGKPVALYYTNAVQVAPVSLGGPSIFLLTDKTTYKLSGNVFNYDPLVSPLSRIIIDPHPDEFKFEKLLLSTSNGSSTPTFNTARSGFAYADGNIYGSIGGLFYYGLPYNRLGVELEPFEASPFMADGSNNGDVFVFFDNTNKRFVYSGAVNFATNVISAAQGFPAAGKYDLVFMQSNGIPATAGASSPSFGMALLHSIDTPAVYRMLKFQFFLGAGVAGGGPKVIYSEIVNDPDIESATNFTISPNFGYVFYTIGSKVYEYDLVTKVSYEVLDKGTNIISKLYFDARARPLPAPNARYMLMISSYDPAGATGSNGVLERYSISAAAGTSALTLVNTWTGFGQIVSTAYRPRPS